MCFRSLNITGRHGAPCLVVEGQLQVRLQPHLRPAGQRLRGAVHHLRHHRGGVIEQAHLEGGRRGAAAARSAHEQHRLPRRCVQVRADAGALHQDLGTALEAVRAEEAHHLAARFDEAPLPRGALWVVAHAGEDPIPAPKLDRVGVPLWCARRLRGDGRGLGPGRAGVAPKDVGVQVDPRGPLRLGHGQALSCPAVYPAR